MEGSSKRWNPTAQGRSGLQWHTHCGKRRFECSAWEVLAGIRQRHPDNDIRCERTVRYTRNPIRRRRVSPADSADGVGPEPPRSTADDTWPAQTSQPPPPQPNDRFTAPHRTVQLARLLTYTAQASFFT